jgi:hypothetical protein
MPLPHGVNITAQSDIRSAHARVAETLRSSPSLRHANHFLAPDAAEAHRIFISTFVQHSNFVHFAVGDVLAGRWGAFAKADDWIKVRTKALKHYYGAGVKEFAFDYYAATQKLLASSPTIELFRGIPRDTARLLFDDLARPGLNAHLYLNPLSSWSDQAAIAERFAARTGGAVITKRLPIEMVFSYWRTDDLLEFILRRQCQQHLKTDPETVGGEAIVWCPLRCIEVTQQDIASDFTQVTPKGSL